MSILFYLKSNSTLVSGMGIYYINGTFLSSYFCNLESIEVDECRLPNNFHIQKQQKINVMIFVHVFI
jgi:hypothetical protein